MGSNRKTHSSPVPSPTPETEDLSRKVALLSPAALGTPGLLHAPGDKGF